MNLGNPAELTILEFAKLIKQLCESKSEIGLEQGLKKTIDWFEERGK
jgi:dTDP-D-glucose 4,6-dehydratase